MKILKYILLLFLLFFVTSSIFVATLKPDYNIAKTKTFNVPKSEIFDYINDLKNWKEFASWSKDDVNSKFVYSKNTIGKSAYYSWISQNSEGNIKTIFAKENDSIYQKITLNDNVSDIYWVFKEKNGKTEITLRNIGKLGFFTKIFSTLSGGIENLIGNDYEKSLDNIAINLKKAVKIYSIKQDGFVEKPAELYLQKTINSKNENLNSNIDIMISNIMKYIKSNKISKNGQPFIKYNSYNLVKQTTCFSICIPIKDSIDTSKSEYKFATMLPFQAMKATLKGNILYKNEAKDSIFALLPKNNLMQKNGTPIIEVYKVSKFDNKDSNSWITEIYIPVKKRTVLKKYIKSEFSEINGIDSSVNNDKTTGDKNNPPATILEKIIIKKDFPQ